jgi:hypothetical protein
MLHAPVKEFEAAEPVAICGQNPASLAEKEAAGVKKVPVRLKASGPVISRLERLFALCAGTSPAFAEAAAHITVEVPPFDEYEVLAFGGQTASPGIEEVESAVP